MGDTASFLMISAILSIAKGSRAVFSSMGLLVQAGPLSSSSWESRCHMWATGCVWAELGQLAPMLCNKSDGAMISRSSQHSKSYHCGTLPLWDTQSMETPSTRAW